MVGSNFLTLKRGNWKIRLKKRYKDPLIKLGIEDPDSLFKRKEARLLDDSERSNIFSFRVSEGRIVLKEYKPRGIGKTWIDLYRPSKAMREFVLGNRLSEMRIPVAEPLAVGEKRNFRLLKKCFLITEELSLGTNLSLHVNSFHTLLNKEKIREKREFISKLAKSIRDIHNRGFTHGDLNTSHIMVRGNRFYYLDFENARLKKRTSDFRWIKDLSRLNESMPSYITRTDKLRFYKEYAKGNKAKEKKIRRYLKRIESRTIKKKG
ncbi:lipopolysaccharide kinase InaA family protein [bacterium]|nr:lipopolysaccharide kinase InaA family protein [bacterium]